MRFGHLAAVILGSLFCFNTFASNSPLDFKLLRTSQHDGFATGELYIGGRLVALSTETLPAKLGPGNYPIAVRQRHPEYIDLELTVGGDVLRMGSCIGAPADCIQLTTTVTAGNARLFDNELGLMIQGGPDAIQNLLSRLPGDPGQPSTGLLRVDSGGGFTYTREYLGTFRDVFVESGDRWRLSEFVNGGLIDSSTFRELSRNLTYIEFEVVDNPGGSASRYRLPLIGGCPSFKVGQGWRVPTSNREPFKRNDSPTDDFSGTCGGTTPVACLNSQIIGSKCLFYERCVDTRVPCGDDGYARGYGQKYCKRFVGGQFTDEGRKWRDATLICLQERLVAPALFSQASCGSVRQAAFNSHPACYTANGSGVSICDIDKLSISDYREIWKVIDAADLFGEEGRAQMIDTLGICLRQWSGQELDADGQAIRAWAESVTAQ